MFGLIDCNNFFASCERVFNPALCGKPVVILSNNVGCIIARSDEAKVLGIPMGAPYYQMEDLIKANNVFVFSSNYRLYGDMSNRVMSTLAGFVPEVEIYSIDEAFLHLDGFDSLFSLEEFGRYMVRFVTKSTGIPVSLGVAPTKTLAKAANHYAKKNKSSTKGLRILCDQTEIEAFLKDLPIEDVWGIGRRYAKFLAQYRIRTAYDFTQRSPEWVRREMSVIGLRTWKELRGEPCIDLDSAPAAKKSICTSRSFGQALTSVADVEQAVTCYTAACARKLRAQRGCAASLMVFLHTNYFRKDIPQYSPNIVIDLPVASADTMELTHYALAGLRKIFKEGYRYKKAGVIVSNIVPVSHIQRSLFDKIDRGKRDRLLQAVDKINERCGHDKIRLASHGFDKHWVNRRERLSPNYTTSLSEVIIVYARE